VRSRLERSSNVFSLLRLTKNKKDEKRGGVTFSCMTNCGHVSISGEGDSEFRAVLARRARLRSPRSEEPALWRKCPILQHSAKASASNCVVGKTSNCFDRLTLFAGKPLAKELHSLPEFRDWESDMIDANSVPRHERWWWRLLEKNIGWVVVATSIWLTHFLR
jgi:hypothetical protein